MKWNQYYIEKNQIQKSTIKRENYCQEYLQNIQQKSSIDFLPLWIQFMAKIIFSKLIQLRIQYNSDHLTLKNNLEKISTRYYKIMKTKYKRRKCLNKKSKMKLNISYHLIHFKLCSQRQYSSRRLNEKTQIFHPDKLEYFSFRTGGGDEYFTYYNQC